MAGPIGLSKMAAEDGKLKNIVKNCTIYFEFQRLAIGDEAQHWLKTSFGCKVR